MANINFEKTVINYPVADLAALKAISTTGLSGGVMCYCVALIGVYAYRPGATGTADNYEIVTCDDGGGQWYRVDPSTRVVNNVSTSTTLTYLPAFITVNPTTNSQVLTFPPLTYLNGAFVGRLITVVNAGTKTMDFNYSDGTTFFSGINAGNMKILCVQTVGTPGSFTLVSAEGSIRAYDAPLSVSYGGTGAVTAATALANLGAVPLAGGTMTGALILSGDATDPKGAATLEQINATAHAPVQFPVTGASTSYTLSYPLASRYVFAPNAGVGLVVTLPAYDATKVSSGQLLEFVCAGGTGCGVTLQDYQGNPITGSGIGVGDSFIGRVGVNTVNIIRFGTASYYEKADFQDFGEKDAVNGYVGKTSGKMNFYNTTGSTKSLIYNTNSITSRSYLFQDRDGTIADDTDLAGKQSTSGKDASGGYAGLTLLKINFKNALNTFTSFLTNANTAARTYTFQDRNGTIADDTDLATKQNMVRTTRVVSGTTGTLTSADRGNIVSCTSSSPITFTLPEGDSSILVGDTFEIVQDGTGIITLLANLSINAPVGAAPVSTNGQYSKITARRIAGGYAINQDAAQTFVFTQRTSNLADLTNMTTAITNLGIGVINNQTGTTYTIQGTDKGKIIYLSNSSAITVTMPNLGVNFFCKLIQKGTGQITLVGSSMTLSSPNGALKTRTQYSDMLISQDTASTAVIGGDLTQ